MKKMTMKIWTQHDSDFTRCLMTPLFYWLHVLLGISKPFETNDSWWKKTFLSIITAVSDWVSCISQCTISQSKYLVSSNYSQNELPIEYLTCRNLEHPKRPQFYNRQRYHDNYRPQYRPREAFQNIYPQVLPHPSGMPRMSRYAERYPRGPEYLNYPPSDYSHSPTGIWSQNYIQF